MSKREGLTITNSQQKNTHLRNIVTFLMSSLLLLSLSACFKTNNTPAQVQEQTGSSSSSLDTTNSNEDIMEWLMPILSEYLADEPVPVPTCGDNTLTHTGNLTLTTQAEVNAFLTNGVGKIDGNLILNPSNSLDLSPLNLLQEITGKFELANNANQTTLAGFDCLTTVSGNFSIFRNNALTAIPANTFSALQTVSGYFQITGNVALTEISATAFSALTVSETFQISGNAALTAIPANAFSALQTVSGNFNIIANAALTAIPANAFSALETVSGNFLFFSNDALTAIPANAFSALETISGNFSISSNPALTAIPANAFSALETVSGIFNISFNDALTDISANSFSALQTVSGDFNISVNDALTDISANSFSALQTVSGDFSISNNNALTDIPATAFSALQTVSGYFSISGNAALTDISANVFSALQTVSGDFNISNNYALTDISATAFSALQTVSGYFNISFNDALTDISGFDVLGSTDIGGTSTVSNNRDLNCQNPDPNFSPVDVSTGNSVNCFTDVAVLAFAFSNIPESNGAYSPIFDYNSSNGAISGNKIGAGIYELSFTGLNLSNSNVQVTAYGFSDGYCSVLSVFGNTVTVHCYDASSDTLKNSAFSIAISNKTTVTSAAKVTAYAVANDKSSTSYTPDSNRSYNAYVGALIAERSSPGNYTMTFPNAGSDSTKNIQVTSMEAGVFCGYFGFINNIATVKCRDHAGTLTDAVYSITIIDSSPPAAGTTTKIVGYAHTVFNYNASGEAVGVVAVADGSYIVNFDGLDLTNNYNIQISTQGSSNPNHYCILGPNGPISNQIEVSCYDESGNLAHTFFSIWVVQK